MEKIYFIKGNKYWKFKNSKTSHILDKTLVFSFICDKCGGNDERIIEKAEELIEMLKILSLNNNKNE